MKASVDIAGAASSISTAPRTMTTRTLGAFMAIAFGLSWGLMAVYMAFPDPITAIFGEVGYTNPLFILASYFRRLTLWRMPLAGWLFLLLGIPAVNYAGAAISGAITAPLPFSPWYTVFPALLTGLLIGPMEEFGWRGVALPLFQRRFAPLWSSLILGIIWGLWHVPTFFMEGTPQSAWTFAPYFVGVVAIAIILTPMFNASKGSLLIPALYHFQMNNPVWPDAQPWASYIFAVVAVAVVLLNRKAMLGRAGAVTGVLYGGEER
jgi:membrane protease YdiL (CAAX protease family)